MSTDGRWDISGVGISDGDRLGAILAEAGQRSSDRTRRNPAYLRRLDEFHDLYLDAIEGGSRRSMLLFQEAQSTNDFPLLMGDIQDRQLLGRYQEIPATWQNYARRGTVRDFRQVRRLAVDGLEGRFYPDYAKPELTEPREAGLTETGYTYAVDVYEKATAINWRMVINDDLDAFVSIPDRLARGARRTEEYFATVLFVDANGPHASLYNAGNANIVNQANGATTDNPPLSIAAFQDAWTVISSQVDAEGEPIMIDMVELVVPPALMVTARNILNATQLELTTSGGVGTGGTGEQRLITANWMRSNVRLSVNPYIPHVASNANGSTSWFLFANPSVSRPALEIGFLRGYESPGLFMKAPNTQRIGGGLAPELGDFDTNEIRYKGMHIIGGTRLDGKATVASNGSGSS